MPPLSATEEKTNNKMCLQIFTSNRVTNKDSILLSKQPASLVGSSLLAAALLSLSCTLDTTGNIMLLILLAMLILVGSWHPLSLILHFWHQNLKWWCWVVMLRLIVCWHFFIGPVSSLFSCTPDTTLIVMLLKLWIMLILIIYWHFFLVASLLYLRLFTPHLLWCWSCC